MEQFINLTIESLEKNYGVELSNERNQAVNQITFDHLKNSRIVFQKEVWAMLQNIALTTQVDAKEVGFLLYGKEFLPNQVYFNKIVLSESPLKSIETEFDSKITEELKTTIDENLDERKVVAHGHSHPKLSEKYEYFSIGDLAGYYELTEMVPEFKNKDMQLVGCLVTPDFPVQFMYYNPADNKFYDFESIEIEEE